jgi:hypothetical protein
MDLVAAAIPMPPAGLHAGEHGRQVSDREHDVAHAIFGSPYGIGTAVGLGPGTGSLSQAWQAMGLERRRMRPGWQPSAWSVHAGVSLR